MNFALATAARTLYALSVRVAAASSRVLRSVGLGENVVRIGILHQDQPQVDLGLINGFGYCLLN